MYDFKIIRVLAEIGSNSQGRKRLTLTRWNGGEVKLDLRNWIETEDGPKPGKGMVLTDQEAETLARGIIQYLREQQAEP